MSWRQVPSPPATDHTPTRWLPIPLGTIPVLVASGDLTSPQGWWLGWGLPILAVNIAIVVVARWNRRARWLAGAAGFLTLALVLGGSAGWRVAAVAVGSALLWIHLLPEGPPAPARTRSVRLALVVAAASAVALIALPGLRAGAALLLVAAAAAGAAALAPSFLERLGLVLEPAARVAQRIGLGIDRGIRRAARPIGHVVAGIAMVPAALVICAMWVTHRVARHDPLRAPVAHRGDWVVRLGPDTSPQRLYASVSISDRRRWPARLAAVLASLIIIALMAGTIAWISPWDAGEADQAGSTDRGGAPTTPNEPASPAGDPACGEPEPDPVLSGQPQYPELQCERATVFSQAEYRSATGFRLQDHEGEVINIEEGVRKTWRPPPCSCRRLTVWWLGGSAAWGEGQRDLWSLPSMVARAAWEEGFALDIENRAMPTFTFNQEVHLLAELTTTEDPPDLVVSYGGGNDLVFQALRYTRGRGEDTSDLALLEQTFDDVLRNGIPVDPAAIDWTKAPQEIDASLPDDVVDDLARSAMIRYERNLGLARRLTTSMDRPFVALWQPLLAGSSAEAGPADVVPADLLASFTRMQGQARDQLPAGVADLGGIYSEATEPVFYDLFHTGEQGAALAAPLVLDALRPTLQAALRRGTG